MKPLTTELIYKIQCNYTGNCINKLKWNEIYDTEEELIKDMFNEKVKVDNELVYKLCKGYEYIKSFRKYYIEYGALTEKQIIQLKRLAANIAYCIYVI